MTDFAMIPALAVSGVFSLLLGYGAVHNSSGGEVVPSTFFTEEKALTSMMLSKSTYCYEDTAELMTQTFEKEASGFQPTLLMNPEFYDITGMVGYLESDESIYVVFRGTVTPENSAMNLADKLIAYDEWPECDCRVHTGY